MPTRTITLELPESLYTRLEQAANATHSTLDQIIQRVVQVGSPPRWDDAPAEFQFDLAALDRMDDAALWRIARSRARVADAERYQDLLDKNANDQLASDERAELIQLRAQFDRAMLCKAHAAALLRWRGYAIPLSDLSTQPQ
jgi:hypothetical protein